MLLGIMNPTSRRVFVFSHNYTLPVPSSSGPAGLILIGELSLSKLVSETAKSNNIANYTAPMEKKPPN